MTSFPERAPVFTGMAGDWWAGNAAALAPKCSLSNLAGSKVLVGVRSCLVHVSAFVTALTTPVDIGLYWQASTGSVGAATLAKVSAGTGADSAQSSDASVELRSRHSADNSVATSITITLGTKIASIPQARGHTLVEQMGGVSVELPVAEAPYDLMTDYPLILRPGESLAVASVGGTANVCTIAVSWVWDEYAIWVPPRKRIQRLKPMLPSGANFR